MRTLLGIALMPLLVAGISCIRPHRKQVVTARPFVLNPRQPKPLPALEPLETPPRFETRAGAAMPVVQVIIPVGRIPPARRVHSVRVEPSLPQGPPRPPVAQIVPQLGPAMSAQERQELRLKVDQYIATTTQILERLKTRRLNQSQAASKERIEAFLQQAQEFIGTDLASARNLAERAQVLAVDLAKNVGGM